MTLGLALTTMLTGSDSVPNPSLSMASEDRQRTGKRLIVRHWCRSAAGREILRERRGRAARARDIEAAQVYAGFGGETVCCRHRDGGWSGDPKCRIAADDGTNAVL